MFMLFRQVLEWRDNQNEEMEKINPISLNYPHMILRTQFSSSMSQSGNLIFL